MKRLMTKIYFFIFLLISCSLSGFSQSIDVSGGLGEYDMSEYPGFPMDGVFYASLTKSTGTIPAGTLGFSISLAAEVPYTGASLNLPPGWVLESSTPTTLYIVNTNVDWTDNEIFVLIPVRAIGPRTDAGQTILVTYDNIGGDWIDPISNNSTKSSVLVVNNPLPVTLVSFSATKESGTALLNWSTTFETNSDHFEVQRSSNGKNWNQIGIVASHGESTSLRNYSFIDSKPMAGENLYRLKMIDRDATFAYSRIRTVSFEKAGEEFYVYPNPSSDFIHINDAENVKAISIIDQKGITVYQTTEVSKEEISLNNLASGMYSVRIEKKDGAHGTQKLVVAR